MTNKKLLLKILALVLIVCMLCTLFVACGDKTGNNSVTKPGTKPSDTPDKPGNGGEGGGGGDKDVSEVAAEALTALLTGAKKSVEEGDMKDLEVSAALDIKTTVGESTHKYSINFDLGLSLVSKKYSNVGNTYLNGEIKDGDDVVLGIYYTDSKNMNKKGDEAMSGNALYLQYKTADGMKKVALNVPYIGGTMTALDAFVNFSNIDLQDEDTWDTIIGFADAAGGLGLFSDASVTKTEASVTIDLDSLIGPGGALSSIIATAEGVDDYLKLLNIDASLSDLIALLPAIKLTIGAKLEEEALVGISLAAELSKIHDIVIKTTEKEADGNTLLYIGIDPDSVKVELDLAYTVNGASINEFNQGNKTDYKKLNLLNMKAGLDIELSHTISVSVGGFTIAVKAGLYHLTFGLDADPTRVLPALFTYKKASTPFDATETYYTKESTGTNLYSKVSDPTATNIGSYYVRIANFNFSSTSGIINAITTILGCVDSAELKLEMTQVNENSGMTQEALEATPYIPILLQIVNKDNNIKATLNVGILGNNNITANKLALSGVIDLIKNMFGISEEEPETPETPEDPQPETPETPEEPETPETPEDPQPEEQGPSVEDILTIVGTYLVKAYLGINDKNTNTGKFVLTYDETKIAINGNTDLTIKVDIDSKTKAEIYVGLDINKGVMVPDTDISVEANLGVTITLDNAGLAITVTGLDTVKDDKGVSMGLPEEVTITMSNGSFSLFDFAGISFDEED